MNPDDAFERCLGLLHEAALDDTRWPAASALIDEACGAGGNALTVGEASGGEHRIHFSRLLYRGESRQDVVREYFGVHYPGDAGMRRLMDRPEGRPVHLPELWSEDERRTSPVYNEGWRLLGARDGLNAHFRDPDGLRLVWSLADPVGSEGWECARLRLIERLLPHVRQFVRVRQALAAAEALGAGPAGLLESGRIGAVQLDRGGRVLAANAPALEILRRGDGLVDEGGALCASLRSDRERLLRLLARALPDAWGEPPAGGSMTVRRASGHARLALHVMPVGDAAADFGGRRAASVTSAEPAPDTGLGQAACILLARPSSARSREHGSVVHGRGASPTPRPVIQVLAQVAHPATELQEHRPSRLHPVARQRLRRQTKYQGRLQRVQIIGLFRRSLLSRCSGRRDRSILGARVAFGLARVLRDLAEGDPVHWPFADRVPLTQAAQHLQRHPHANGVRFAPGEFAVVPAERRRYRHQGVRGALSQLVGQHREIAVDRIAVVRSGRPIPHRQVELERFADRHAACVARIRPARPLLGGRHHNNSAHDCTSCMPSGTQANRECRSGRLAFLPLSSSR